MYHESGTYPLTAATYQLSDEPSYDVLNNDTIPVGTFTTDDEISLTCNIDISGSPIELDVPICIGLRMEWEDASGEL